MILILDNHDSFTHNLIHQVEGLGYKAALLQSDQTSIAEVEALQPAGLILSAGPKTPTEAGITLDVVDYFIDKLPILGVCLGFQSLAVHGGCRLVGSKDLIHGRAANIKITAAKLFDGVKEPFMAAKYNSLVIDGTPLGYNIIATDDEQQIMAIEHKKYPVFGVQFHIESFMTKQGQNIMRNFLSATGSPL